MNKQNNNYLIFGGLALITIIGLYLLLATTTNWNWLLNWIIASSIVAFAFYGVDKVLSKTNARRVPELVLHALSLLGGFIGAILGMLAFRHKSNFRAHPLFIPVMIIGAVLWGFIAYWFFWR